MKAIVAILAIMAAILLSPVCMSAGTSPTTRTSAAPTVIHSSAELKRYLKATPLEESPLSLLPAGARKRFLGTLVWGRKGVGGFNTADLEQYLTDTQIRQVLALFDLQGDASGLHGRVKPLTAKDRGAAETQLEHRFDKLYFAYASGANENASDSGHDVSMPPLYDRLLAAYQKPATIAKLDDSDAGLLFRAAGLVSFISHGTNFLDDLRLDLGELHRRGLATSAQVADVHNQFVAARRFNDANTLARAYPEAGIEHLPPLHQAANVHDGSPTVLVMNPDGKSMSHKTIGMQVPLRIVVVAGCHFSEDAARAIRADPKLDNLFHEHAIWLAPENESLPDVLLWNREFPDQIMNVAWRNSQWHMLDSWLIPTFYVFRKGTLIEQWSGWPAGTTVSGSLRAHLEKAGVLR